MQRHLLLAGLLAAVVVTPTLAASDKFNRDALGGKWVVPQGALAIRENQLQGTDFALGYFKKAKSNNSGSVKVQLNTTATQYGALALGDIAGGNNAYVKIQSQNGVGTFDTAGFYVNNGSSLFFFTLDAPMDSPATLSVSFSGTVATMKIKSPSGAQSYEYDYGTTYGNGVGLGTYGPVSLDNLKTKSTAADAFGPAPRRVTFSDAVDLSQ